MRLKRLLNYFSDLLWLKLLGGNSIKKEYKERARRVIERILSLYDPTEPYVIEGKWSWFTTPSGFHPPISLVLLDHGLAILVLGPEVGLWKDCKLYCKGKSDWEISNIISSSFTSMCSQLDEVTGISVYWDDPIDVESLKLKLPLGNK